MSVREYIGARYVPIFGRKDETSIAWDDTKPYEPLTIVLYQGNSYTSRQYVPAGIPITNETYWALTGNYNAQVEAYRAEVATYGDRIDENADRIDDLENADAQIILDYQAADSQITTDYQAADAQIINDYQAADARINTRLSNLYTQANFRVADRFIMGEMADYASAQAGCIFEQNDVLYWAQIVIKANTAQDRLVIRSIASNSTVCDVQLSLDHGYSLTYNPTTKELLTSDATNGNFICINVANINAPVISRIIPGDFFPFNLQTSMFTWKGNYIAGLHWSSKIVYVYSTDGTLIESNPIEFDNNPVPQNFQYNDATDEYYIGMSMPNCVSVVNATTGKQTNAIELKNFYSYIYMRELETAQRVGDYVFATNYEEVDDLLVICLLQADIVNGTIGANQRPNIDPDTGALNLVVDYNNGSLLPQLALRGSRFKLAGDAIKLAQSVNAMGITNVNFTANYPHPVKVIGADVRIGRLNSTGDITIGGIYVMSGTVVITDGGLKIRADNDYTLSNVDYSSAIFCQYGDVILASGSSAPSVIGGSGTPVLCHLANSNGNFLQFVPSAAQAITLMYSEFHAVAASYFTFPLSYRSTRTYSS